MWEDVIEPLEVADAGAGASGAPERKPLVLSDAQFRQVVSLLEDAEELGEEELPPPGAEE